MLTPQLRLASLFLAAGLAAPITALAQPQVFPTWNGPANGSWSVAGNWTPFGVPNNSGTATFAPIIPGGGSPVLNIAVTLDKFGIGPGAAIQMNNNISLTVRGQTDGLGVTGLMSNEGTLSMNSVGNLTDLIISGGVGAYAVHGNTFGTTARILLSNTSANRIYGATGNEKLILETETLLEGAGQLGLNLLELDNSGQIHAVGSTGLVIDPNVGGVTNRGVLGATGGPLTLTSGVFRNIGGGAVILATDTQTVALSTARVEGGLIETSGSGVINSFGSTLAGVSLNGTLVIPNNTNARIESLLTFTSPVGLLSMQSVGNFTDLIITSPVTTLDGFAAAAGVTMSNTSANRIYGESGDRRLVLTDTAFIRGAGQVGIGLMSLTIDPACVIDAVGSAGLTINPNADGVINRGLLRATAGSTLTLASGAFDNAGAEVRADSGGTVLISSSTLLGGLLTSAGVGQFITTASTLDSMTSNAVINLNNNASSTLRSSLINNITFSMNSVGNNTDLIISGATTISGPGVLAMSNAAPNRIYAANSADRLTNAPGHTIRGSGQIGVGLMALTNNGLIEALGSAGLTIDPNVGGVLNNATIRVRTGSHLALTAGAFNNAAGVIDVQDAAACTITGATVVGGLFTSAGSGNFIAVASTFDSVTSNAVVNLNNNNTSTIRSSLINNSTFSMNSVGNNTDLLISGNTTLSGVGVLAMSNAAPNRIYAANSADRLTNAPGHTIRGSGQIGVGLMALTNQGTIEASASAGMMIDTNVGGFDNQGLLHVSGGTMTIGAGTLTTSGTVIVDAGRLLNRSSGTWVQTGGGVLANGELQVVANSYLLQGGTLGGSGLVDSNVTNSGGAIAPGNSPGTLTIEGNYIQQVGGTLAIEITGVTSGTQNDLLTILGTASLNGTISITRPTAFLPAIGQSFTILTTTGTNTLTGTFSAISSPDFWHVVYLNNAAVIVFDGEGPPPCPADFNRDGTINVQDIFDFLSAWFAANPRADVNGVNGINVQDIFDFLTAWFAGC